MESGRGDLYGLGSQSLCSQRSHLQRKRCLFNKGRLNKLAMCLCRTERGLGVQTGWFQLWPIWLTYVLDRQHGNTCWLEGPGCELAFIPGVACSGWVWPLQTCHCSAFQLEWTDNSDASNQLWQLQAFWSHSKWQAGWCGRAGDPEQSRHPVVHSLWLPLGSGLLSCCPGWGLLRQRVLLITLVGSSSHPLHVPCLENSLSLWTQRKSHCLSRVSPSSPNEGWLPPLCSAALFFV